LAGPTNASPLYTFIPCKNRKRDLFIQYIAISNRNFYRIMKNRFSTCSDTAVTAIPADSGQSAILTNKAVHLAELLQIKLIEAQERHKYNPLLLYTEKGLQIQLKQAGNHHKTSNLHVDFLSDALNYRRQHGGGIKQAIARAVGIKPGFRPSIIDATAGLGKDSFLLCSLGCTVYMIERSPMLASLLLDGLERAIRAQALPFPVEKMMTLAEGDAAEIIKDTTTVHTIYLDPMYPHSSSSALNKLEMRMIRFLVGDDLDAAKLLDMALEYAGNRVVVKRPKGAPVLNNISPNHAIKMKNSRYDVYMI